MSNGKLPYIAFYTGDWFKDPNVSRCSLATRGFWLELLFHMHNTGTGTIRGTLADLARMTRSSEAEAEHALYDLKRTKTAEIKNTESVTQSVTVTLWSVTSRRLTRECNRAVTRREKTRKRVRKHRLTKVIAGGNASETPVKRSGNATSSYSSSYSSSEETDFPSSSSDEEDSKNPSTHTHSSSARSGPPAEQAADAAVCVRGSFYSLEDCRKYAESLGDIRNPAGFAKTIFASGSDDQAISEFLANGGHRETDKEHSARIARLAELR